jgi:hypothetical protein
MEKTDESIAGEMPETSYFSKCQACGEAIGQPIFAKVTLANTTEEYEACPKCLSKMQRAEVQENAETNEFLTTEQANPENIVSDRSPKDDPTEDSNCPYEFGYLRKHQRNLPIPEECMICKKMIECRI